VGAGETYDVSQVMHEQKARLDLMLVSAAVDGGGYLVLHKLLLSTTGLAASGKHG
jgi:hypothetical protein